MFNLFSMGNFVSYRDAQIYKKNEGSSIQSPEEDVVTSNISSSLENLQSTSQVHKVNHNGKSHDDPQGETLSKEQKHEDSPLENCVEIKIADKSNNIQTDITFQKELVVVVDDCFKNTSQDMVNSTAQHPKTRNPTNSSVAANSNSNTTSNNSTASTRDPTVVKEHIINDTIKIMTTKSPLSTTPIVEVNIFYTFKLLEMVVLIIKKNIFPY